MSDTMQDTRTDLPKRLNLGCGEDHRGGYHNVDAVGGCNPDEVVDLGETPWPWPDVHFDRVLASHVLEHLPDVEMALSEVARILRPGGVLEVRWPIGMNERADPDHKHAWVWDTPLYYCGARLWDADVGLDVIHRDVTLHTHLEGWPGAAYSRSIRWYERRRGPGRWQFDLPVTSGEFTVIFKKP